jgi:hypothetical protein
MARESAWWCCHKRWVHRVAEDSSFELAEKMNGSTYHLSRSAQPLGKQEISR